MTSHLHLWSHLFIVFEGVAIAIVKELILTENQITEYCDRNILDRYVVSDIISHIFRVDIADSVAAVDALDTVEKVVFLTIPSQIGFDYYVSCCLNFIECD